MAKRQANHSVANNGQQQIVHTSYEEDDNLLPKPEELEKYVRLDPDFINWMKNRCDVEQLARIKHTQENVKLVKSTNNKLFTVDIITILLSTFLIFALLFGAYHLVLAGHEKLGTIFGGVGLITFTIRLLNFRRHKKEN